MSTLPLDACPFGKHGGHDLAVICREGDVDITAVCVTCGAACRWPASGPLYAERLDDLSADEIVQRIDRTTALRPFGETR